MDSRLKQRLIGAAVLIALAVIFLPMLIKEPAPDSGVSDMSLNVPESPAGLGTIDLPLMTDSVPAPVPVESASTEDSPQEPAADTDTAQGTAPAASVTQDSRTDALLPASVASGQYVVHYATFASQSEADEMARQLQAKELPAQTQPTTFNGRPAISVRIGPYADRAAAETARVHAAQVRGDVRPLVLVLDADEDTGAGQVATSASDTTTGTASSSRPTAQAGTSTETASSTAVAPATSTGRPTTVASARSSSASQTRPATSPAAAVGFVVQVGAFSDATRARALERRLEAANLPVFTDTVNTRRGRLTRVNAGPVSGRTEAERLKTQVKSAVGTDGVIRRHP